MTITAVVSDADTLQWEVDAGVKDSLRSSSGGAISGATTDTLSINPVDPSHTGAYRIAATNVGVTVTSASSSVNVQFTTQVFTETWDSVVVATLPGGPLAGAPLAADNGWVTNAGAGPGFPLLRRCGLCRYWRRRHRAHALGARQ